MFLMKNLNITFFCENLRYDESARNQIRFKNTYHFKLLKIHIFKMEYACTFKLRQQSNLL